MTQLIFRNLVGISCACGLLCALGSGSALAQNKTGQGNKSSAGGNAGAGANGNAAGAGNQDNPQAGPSGASGAKPAPTGNGNVAYTDLAAKPPKVALPYGTPFTITGDVKDVQLMGQKLSDLLKVQSVTGNYTTSDGLSGTIPSASVSGTSWQAAIGKLNPDTSATINFQFVGIVPPGTTEQRISTAMLADPAFNVAISQFERSAQGQPTAVVTGALNTLAQAIAAVVTSVLSDEGLTPKDLDALKNSLSTAILNNTEYIYNLVQRIPAIRAPNNGYAALVGMDPATFSGLSLQQLYGKLKQANYSVISTDPTDPVRQATERLVNGFLGDMDRLTAALNPVESATFIGTAPLAVGNDQQSDLVSDLKKYAGFDLGALYAYRLSELRGFAMVNIYWGPVQLSTSAPKSKTGAGEWIRERFSLSFGVALKDISGATDSKISGENAFVYGIGFRLNKYFRLTAGGLLYRAVLPAINGSTSPANGSLRQEFFVGPSIDVTAVSALKSIFAASKSTN